MPARTNDGRRAMFLRHHVEDDPGFVGDALARRGFAVDVTDVTDDTAAIDLDGVELLGILGSKWSVYDDEVSTWLTTELAAIAEAARRDVPMLGICFGAQALCLGLGGTVEPAPRVELGWVELTGNEAEGIPDGPWFQFHGDACLVPATAQVLARNDVCVQAFRIGRHLGVQFHPELDAVQFARWLDAGAGAYCVEAGASPAALLEDVERHQLDAARRTDALVGAFVARAAS